MEIKKERDNLILTITVPLSQSGKYTYGEGTWIMPALCVWIDDNLQDFSLNYTQYLDYKDSLQATSPIASFTSKEEALKAAEDFNLSVEYATPRDFTN